MSAREEILENWSQQLEGMDSADTDLLRPCFTRDAVLVHMTGYVQPLDEWMDGINRGEFVYHRLEERSVEITSLAEKTAHIQGFITTGITDDGSGHAWNLHCEQDFVLTSNGHWLCSESRVTMG